MTSGKNQRNRWKMSPVGLVVNGVRKRRSVLSYFLPAPFSLASPISSPIILTRIGSALADHARIEKLIEWKERVGSLLKFVEGFLRSCARRFLPTRYGINDPLCTVFGSFGS